MKANRFLLRNDDRAQFDLSGALGVVGLVIGAVVVMSIVAALFPTFADATADVNDNLTNDTVTFGDTTTDSIKGTFAIVVGLTALVGIVGVILAAFRGRLGGNL